MVRHFLCLLKQSISQFILYTFIYTHKQEHYCMSYAVCVNNVKMIMWLDLKPQLTTLCYFRGKDDILPCCQTNAMLTQAARRCAIICFPKVAVSMK